MRNGYLSVILAGLLIAVLFLVFRLESAATENTINDCLILRVWEDGSLRGKDAEIATACLKQRGVYSEFLERFSD